MTTPTADDLKVFRPSRAVIGVFLGGFVGTFVRAWILHDVVHASRTGLLRLTPTWTTEVPLRLLIINTVGVFVAAWLLAGPLRLRAPDDPVRLFAVTGILGGLTSYSSLFVALEYMRTISWVGAGIVLVGAVSAGVLAGIIGIKVARK